MHQPLSGFPRPLDEAEFTAVRQLAAQGDLDAMVDYAFELRRRGAAQEATSWFARAAAAGDERAAAELTAASSQWAPDAGQPNEPLEWAMRSAEAGNRDCMLILARAYRDGDRGMARDFRQMLRWALHAAADHSPEAMRLVSDAYALGQGVPQDAARALLWLKRAAAAGDATAIHRIAEHYLTGPRGERDPRGYFDWTRKGAETGDPTLMFNLAEAYRDGIGTAVDHAAFFHWINRAANRGHPAALYKLALAYRDGTGVKPDVTEYQRLIMRAADAGDPQAMNNLALQYLHGEGVPVDAKRHVELLTRAARGGEASAMFNLAHAYRDGLGVARDPAQYLVWLGQAVESHHRHAQVELAAHYFGEALDKRRQSNPGQVAVDLRFERLATSVAEAGDARGMYLLAMGHRLGVGVLSDAELARQWTERAASAGLPVAMLDLADLYQNDRQADPAGQQYFTWLERAARAGDVVAKRRLALACHDGLGTTRDLAACGRWLEAASSAGDQVAFVLLGLVDLERAGEIEPTRLHSVLEPFTRLQAQVARIKRAQLVREAPEGVAHFTTASVLRTLLGTDRAARPANRLRLYNAGYLKDAGDGRYLFDFPDSPGAKLLGGFFPEQRSRDWPLATPWDGREYSVYLGSFNLRADYLDLWRTEGADGTGVCIVTPLAAFAQDRARFPFALGPGGVSNEAPAAFVPVLYRVNYDPRAAAAALEGLSEPLAAIQAFKLSLKQGQPTVDALVRILVSEILYLFKPEAYRGGCEARIVAAFDIAAGCVHRDTSTDPGRLYVETEPFFFSAPGSQILIGPAVENRAVEYLDLRYRFVRSRWGSSTQVGYSAIEYR